MMRKREGKLLFTRKKVFPLSPRPSLPFKKSGETFLFTFTYPCREQSLFKKMGEKGKLISSVQIRLLHLILRKLPA